MAKDKLVIFDCDGTLFRTETVDIWAFNRALEENGFKTRSDEEILRLIGITLEEICEKLLPGSNEDAIRKFISDVIKFEEEAIIASGQLYPGVIDVLERLKGYGYTLCICSNGNEEYISGIAKKFNLYLYFEEVWFERKGISKCEAVKILKEKYNADKFIMVGDRTSDIDAGERNNGITIGVSYGFGGEEVEKADFKASTIEEVEGIIIKLYEV